MKMIDSPKYGPAASQGHSRIASTADALGTSTEFGFTAPCRRWHWHYRALIKLRERLLKQRADLAAAILEPLESFSLDIADAATDQFDHDLALSLLSAEQDTLFEIEAALSRIRAGTYGLCEVTGKPISAARLRAVPWTRFGQKIEGELERQGVCRPPHLGEVKSVHAQISFDRANECENDNEESL